MINFDRSFTVVNGISLSNYLGIFEGSQNPSLTGEEAPVGSLFIRGDGNPSIWQKTDVNNVDWERLPNLQDLLFISGEVSGFESTISTLTGDILNLSAEISGNTVLINNLSGDINNLSGDIIFLSGVIDGLSGDVINNTTNIASNSADILDLSGQISGTVSGGVEFIDDLLDVDTSSYVPVTGDFLRWNGSDWIPSSSPEVTGIPVSNNLVWAYDTLIQTLSAINTFQTVTFDQIIVAEGWTYSNGDFTSESGGAFMATFEFNVEKNGGGNVEVTVKANKNNVELAGSHNGMDITSNNTAFSISRTFLFLTEPNDVINFQMAGNNTTARLLPAPVIGGITTPTGATLLIRRIV